MCLRVAGVLPGNLLGATLLLMSLLLPLSNWPVSVSLLAVSGLTVACAALRGDSQVRSAFNPPSLRYALVGLVFGFASAVVITLWFLSQRPCIRGFMCRPLRAWPYLFRSQR